MTSQYRIIIRNMSSQTLSFYAFQRQASFTDSGAAPAILSSSLATGPLAPDASSGARLDFAFDAQAYVGATSDIPTWNEAATFGRTARHASSKAFAFQPIQLTTPDAAVPTANCSSLAIVPLGLSAPSHQPGVPAGSFGIQVPTFTSSSAPNLHCGCAAVNQDGSISLSSYIQPLPGSQIYCAPVPIYYVKLGSFQVGQPITYDVSQSALCDFTQDPSTIDIQYESDGSFTTMNN